MGMILLAREHQSGMSGIHELKQNEKRKKMGKQEREIKIKHISIFTGCCFVSFLW